MNPMCPRYHTDPGGQLNLALALHSRCSPPTPLPPVQRYGDPARRDIHASGSQLGRKPSRTPQGSEGLFSGSHKSSGKNVVGWHKDTNDCHAIERGTSHLFWVRLWVGIRTYVWIVRVENVRKNVPCLPRLSRIMMLAVDAIKEPWYRWSFALIEDRFLA